MSTERISFKWSFKQLEVENNDCGILAEQAGPIVHLSELEVETLAATLEAMRGHEPCECEIDNRVELEVETVLCMAAAKLARASRSGNLRACDRLLLELLEKYSTGQLLDQEAEVPIMRFERDVRLVQHLTDQLESMQPDQLQSLTDQLGTKRDAEPQPVGVA